MRIFLLFTFSVIFSTLILCSNGCAFGGARVETEYIMVEAGSDAVVVAQDRPIQIMSWTPDAKAHVSEKNCAGMVLSPKSVFNIMRSQSLQLREFSKENQDAWKAFQAKRPALFKDVEAVDSK